MRTSTGETRRPARKRFGQHFLEAVWAAKLIAAIAPDPAEVFIEIGPGRGALTRLLDSARHVIAIEIDRDLIAELAAAGLPNVTVLSGDVLALPLEQVRAEVSRFPGAKLRVVGNLPYNIASPILFKLIEWYQAGLPIANATVMLQREVADRLQASPGSHDYSVLSIRIQQWARVSRVLALPPGAFRPAPRVHSAVVRLEFRPASPAPENQAVFEQLVQAIFSHRRKTLRNAVEAYSGTAGRGTQVLVDAGIDPIRRPETLDLDDLVRLADRLAR